MYRTHNPHLHNIPTCTLLHYQEQLHQQSRFETGTKNAKHLLSDSFVLTRQLYLRYLKCAFAFCCTSLCTVNYVIITFWCSYRRKPFLFTIRFLKLHFQFSLSLCVSLYICGLLSNLGLFGGFATNWFDSFEGSAHLPSILYIKSHAIHVVSEASFPHE